MALARIEDPDLVCSYRVKRRRGLELLALIGAVGFVAIGLWMMLADTGIIAKAAGAFCVAFFGWSVAIYVQLMSRGAVVVCSREGLSCAFAPRYGSLKLIPWRDIEGFGISQVQSQEFNFVRLARYDTLIEQFSESEIAETLKAFRSTMRFAAAGKVVFGAKFEFKDAAETANVSASNTSKLQEMFRFSRHNFGGEICLGWLQRDRSAKRFHELLTAWQVAACAKI